MPCVRLAKLSVAEEVGQQRRPHTATLIVAHCSLCRTPHARANSPASVDRVPVVTSLSVSTVRGRQSRTCDEVTHVGDLLLQRMFTRIHRTASDFNPAIAVSRITFHFALVEIGTNFKTGLPYVHASRPLPKTPTGKLHPECLHNWNQLCHSRVRITKESSCESREQIVYGCPVVDATVPTIAARRHQGRAAFQSN